MVREYGPFRERLEEYILESTKGHPSLVPLAKPQQDKVSFRLASKDTLSQQLLVLAGPGSLGWARQGPDRSGDLCLSEGTSVSCLPTHSDRRRVSRSLSFVLEKCEDLVGSPTES